MPRNGRCTCGIIKSTALTILALVAVLGGLPCFHGKVALKTTVTAHAILHNSSQHELQNRSENIRRVTEWAAPDGLVLWTLANYGWKDFVFNWVATVKRAEISNFFVATLDERLHTDLEENGVPCVSLHTTLGSENIEWGTDAFKERGREKIRFILAMLEAGLSPMFSDLDVAWLRNPLPYIRQFEEANVLVSSDLWKVSGEEVDKLDNCTAAMGSDREIKAHHTFVGKMNVGIHVLRPSAYEFVEAWLVEMETTGEMEQLCWNAVILRNMDAPTHADSYCRSMEGKVVAGLLPVPLFENGLTFFIQQLPERLGVEPYAVHESYIAGTFNKIYHLRESLLWHVDPHNRYSSDVKLLSVELDLPEELMEIAVPPKLTHNLGQDDVHGHMLLAQEQYIQIRAAASLAKALNRSLIMPQLWCGLENLWAAHPGRVWGGIEYEQPAECPMSQLFHPERWEADAAGAKILPPMLESSYLSNPHTQIQHGDLVHVTACSEGDVNCCGVDEECSLKLETLSLSQGLSKADILEILQGAKDARLLKVSQADLVWPAAFVLEEEKFSHAFEKTRRGWCCATNGSTPLLPLDEEIIS